MPQREHVSFAGDGTKLAGHLFLPDDAGADDTAPVAGVVVAGTWTSVKEQMADRYAERLARRGFAALSFDFTGYGESAGEPRDVESPALKVQDLRAGADLLTRHPAVNGAHLGAMYVSAFACEDPRVRSLALVAPWHGAGRRRPERSPTCRWSAAATRTRPCPSTSTSTSTPSAAVSRRFHDGLAGSGELLWTEGVQFDFYDRSPQVDFVTDATAEHFARTL